MLAAVSRGNLKLIPVRLCPAMTLYVLAFLAVNVAGVQHTKQLRWKTLETHENVGSEKLTLFDG